MGDFMTNSQLDSKVIELRQLKDIAEQIKNMIENIKDEIKSEMIRRGVETLDGKDWRIIWREHTYTRLDAERLEADFGDLSEYKKFTKYKSFYLRKK